jgi:hypothetical protein
VQSQLKDERQVRPEIHVHFSPVATDFAFFLLEARREATDAR